MRRREFLRGAAAAGPLAAIAGQEPGANPAPQQEPPGVALPKPQMQGGKPLMEALNDRKTTRNMSDEKLSPQMLSNLLWAAFGINRPSSRGRTAPSARNLQEVDIYVFLTEGVYLFDAVSHTLKPVLGGDYRAKTGQQAGVGKPPVSLVYVTDLDKVSSPSQPAWTHADCGFIGQNVYLFAASEGLASWFRALVDGAALAKLLSLRANQKVLYAQGIGYPAKA